MLKSRRNQTKITSCRPSDPKCRIPLAVQAVELSSHSILVAAQEERTSREISQTCRSKKAISVTSLTNSLTNKEWRSTEKELNSKSSWNRSERWSISIRWEKVLGTQIILVITSKIKILIFIKHRGKDTEWEVKARTDNSQCSLIDREMRVHMANLVWDALHLNLDKAMVKWDMAAWLKATELTAVRDICILNNPQVAMTILERMSSLPT